MSKRPTRLGWIRALKSHERHAWNRSLLASPLQIEALETRRLLTATPPGLEDGDVGSTSGIIAVPLVDPATVVARKLFYNQSGTGGATVRYDGNDPAINSLDDNAIATDKVAYRPDTAFTVRRLTNNNQFDSEPRVFGTNVVWQGRGGTDGGTDEEIFINDGFTTTQLTTNSVLDRFPKMSSGGMVWERGNATTQEVIFYNGSETQVTTNSVFDGNASLSGSRIAWQQGSGAEVDVMSWESGTTTNLSNIAGSERTPHADGNATVWVSGLVPSVSIKLKDGANPTVDVTTSSSSLEDPKVSGTTVVWEGFAGGTSNDREIYMYNGGAPIRLTTNAFPDFDPQISGNNVVWWGGTFNNFHIYLYDGVSVRQISTGIRNQFPKIDGDNIVWQSYDGADNEIMFWNGQEVIQLTDNTLDDTMPQISGNHVTWQALSNSDGTTQEIYDATIGAGPATFANVSSYSKGINGVMIDIAGTHGSITAADFEFRIGNNNSPSTWDPAPAPASVSVRAGAGVSGSDRVEIIWANGDIQKQWLEVITLANANTGLAQKAGYPAGQGDVFFFGNAIGNTGLGDTAVNSTVNAIDEGGARNNPQIVGNNIPITNLYDFNRNALVNAVDEGISRNNSTNSSTVLKYINLANPPLAPQGDAGDIGNGASENAGVASALSVTASPSAAATGTPAAGAGDQTSWRDFADSEPEGRTKVDWCAHLASANTPRARAILAVAGGRREAVVLEDDLLEKLAIGRHL